MLKGFLGERTNSTGLVRNAPKTITSNSRCWTLQLLCDLYRVLTDKSFYYFNLLSPTKQSLTPCYRLCLEGSLRLTCHLHTSVPLMSILTAAKSLSPAWTSFQSPYVDPTKTNEPSSAISASKNRSGFSDSSCQKSIDTGKGGGRVNRCQRRGKLL